MTDDIKARLLAMDDCDGRGCAVCAAIATIEALEGERDLALNELAYEVKTRSEDVASLRAHLTARDAEIARLRDLLGQWMDLAEIQTALTPEGPAR